jgi:cytochrome c oxidase subunit 2
MLAQTEPTFWLPPRVATGAEQVDWLFSLIFWISAFFFGLIVVLMLVFVTRYLRRGGRQPEKTLNKSLALELTWTIVPVIIVITIFYYGFVGFMDMVVPPDDAYRIDVLAQKWNWEFTYPNGHKDAHLHVPVDRDIVLVMTSDDVIHSLFIPAFRLKKDAVPGRFTKTWFRATQPGEYLILCAEYCGTGHSDMTADCVVHAPGEFEKWLENADPLKKLTDEQYQAYLDDPDVFIAEHPDIQGLETPVVMGRKLYERKGCRQCHSVDGSGGTGPTFRNLFDAARDMQDGSSVTADENYIRESIVNPQAKVRAGYQNVMPTYQGRLTDREITFLIAYIRSLSQAGGEITPSGEVASE